MIDSSRALHLGDEFPAPSHAEWRAAVNKVLARGAGDLDAAALDARFERDLVTHTVDGLTIQPLYTDLGDAPEPGVAGAAPFTRGADVLAHRGGWDVRQRVVATDEPADTAARVLEELERGSTSVLLDLAAVDGVDADHLDAALDDVLVEIAPIVLSGAVDAIGTATAFLDLLERRNAPAETTATLGLDPLGRWATTAAGDVAESLRLTAAAAKHGTQRFPAVRPIVVDASSVHEAGGGDVEELAYAAAAGLAYLRSLVDAGLAVDAACGQLEFRFAATPDQFLTVAKFRAARRLWQRLTAVSGATTPAQAQRQHAISSGAAASRYDIWVNMLRGTVECFGAGVGGADAVTILPHDELLVTGGSELGRRMARNTQLVLIEESHVAKVVDMAGGSWYVEQLTDQLAHAAWALMQDMERAGGFVAAIERNVLQERIEATRARRDAAVATRRMALTGVTEFPNIADVVSVPPGVTGLAASGAPFVPLTRRRYAEPIETQRWRADRMASSHARPTVFLAALGTTASSSARVSFAKNFFEAGGIAAVVADATTDGAELRRAFEASGADLACLCASDATYADFAVAALAALRAADPARLYLAGRPKGMADDLAAAGVDEQIAVGTDVVSTVRTALDTIGAPE